MSTIVARILQIMDQFGCDIPTQKMCSFDDGSFDYQFSDLQDPLVAQSVKTLMQMCIIHGHGDSGDKTKTGLYHPNRALTV